MNITTFTDGFDQRLIEGDIVINPRLEGIARGYQASDLCEACGGCHCVSKAGSDTAVYRHPVGFLTEVLTSIVDGHPNSAIDQLLP